MGRSPKSPGPDSELLFDLPLDSSTDGKEKKGDSDRPAEPADETGADQADLAFTPEGAIEVEPPAPREAPLAPRFLAGALDLLVLVAILALAVVAVRLIGVPLSRDSWIPLVVFLASFSFLYHVIPLAFWGNTPGMAYAGIVSRSKDGDFLTIQQCMLRWLGWSLTVLTAGLASLVALSGISLTDLVSGSRLYRQD